MWILLQRTGVLLCPSSTFCIHNRLKQPLCHPPRPFSSSHRHHDDVSRLKQNRKQLLLGTWWLSMISCKMCQLQTFVISTVLGHDALCCYCPIFRGSGGTPRCADYTRSHSQGSQCVHHSIWWIMSVVCSPRTHTASPGWPCTLWVQLLMRHVRKHAGRNLLMGTFPRDTVVYTKLRSTYPNCFS